VDPNHGHEAMQHAAMAAAAALSHPFFLAAAAASSRDANHSSLEQSSTPRIPPFDDHHHHHLHHHLQSPSPTNKLFERSSIIAKRSLSPSFLSRQATDDAIGSPMKKSVTTLNNLRSTCFTPVTTNSSSSLLSPVSKLKIIAKGTRSDDSSETSLRSKTLRLLENNSDQQQSITISIELNGIAYQGTLYAAAGLTANKE
jgi:hypothetical protein